MRLLMILTTVALAVTNVGCAKDSSPEVASAGVSATMPPRTSTPTDYSKILCINVSECALACDITSPSTDESTIRQSYCMGQSSSSTCDALVDFHYNLYGQSNDWCKSLKVTEVINPDVISDSQCTTVPSCRQRCISRYVPQTDLAIERWHAAHGTLNSGSYFKDLVINQVVREQLSACLEAPADFVMQ